MTDLATVGPDKPHWTQTDAGKAKMSKAMKKKHAAKRAEGKPWKTPEKKAKKAVKKPSRKGTLIPLSAIPAVASKPRAKAKPKLVKATVEGSNTREVALELLRMAIKLLEG